MAPARWEIEVIGLPHDLDLVVYHMVENRRCETCFFAATKYYYEFLNINKYGSLFIIQIGLQILMSVACY